MTFLLIPRRLKEDITYDLKEFVYTMSYCFNSFLMVNNLKANEKADLQTFNILTSLFNGYNIFLNHIVLHPHFCLEAFCKTHHLRRVKLRSFLSSKELYQIKKVEPPIRDVWSTNIVFFMIVPIY